MILYNRHLPFSQSYFVCVAHCSSRSVRNEQDMQKYATIEVVPAVLLHTIPFAAHEHKAVMFIATKRINNISLPWWNEPLSIAIRMLCAGEFKTHEFSSNPASFFLALTSPGRG